MKTSKRLGQERATRLSRKDRSVAVYSVSSDYQYRPKLQSPLYPRTRTTLLKTGQRCQLWQHGPRHLWTWEKHSGGGCQKISPSRSTSIAEGEPIRSQLSCRHPSNHLAVRERLKMSAHRMPTSLTSRSTAMPSALCHLSRRCHRCARIMTGQGVYQSRSQGRQGYITTHWTPQKRLL